MKANVKSNFNFKIPYEFDEPVNIWIDNFDGIEQQMEGIKIFVVMEPPGIIQGMRERVSQNSRHFDYILTFDDWILENVKNSVLFEFGTKWINVDNYDFNIQKDFSVSTVCGHKIQTKGHKMRHKVWNKQNLINIPKRFFISKHGGVRNLDNNLILQDEKEPLFDSMFHICIENVSNDYYFSEKLIDSLLTKTIPVYWGCNKIEKYFNTDGIFRVENENEIIEVCNSLTEEDYFSKIEVIEDNFNRALSWIDYSKRLKDKIEKLKVYE